MCTSGDPKDLAVTDGIAASVLEEIGANVSDRIKQQYRDNIRWIKEAGKHKMVSFPRSTPAKKKKITFISLVSEFICFCLFVFSLFRLWDLKPESSTPTREDESASL